MTSTDRGSRGLPTTADILATRSHIDPVFLDTPEMRHPGLDEALGCAVTLKLETLGPIRSFKGRGTEALIPTIDGAIRKGAQWRQTLALGLTWKMF